MKGQGMVEYALIAVLIVVLLIVIVATIGPKIGVIQEDPCFTQPGSFECRDAQVNQCLETERYTKDQCVILVGGGGD